LSVLLAIQSSASSELASSESASNEQLTGEQRVGSTLIIESSISCLSQHHTQCLNIGQDQFDKILDCKELNWLCGRCSKEVMEIERVRNRDDRLVEMMSAVLEKVTGMERVLSQKADLGVVEALEERLKALEKKFVIDSQKPKRQEVANDHEGELREVESVA